ncbi:hypothetical protein ACFLQU_03035 [Verrucomicrobiota bacterium]
MAHGRLHIGWAHGDITPPRKTFLLGQFHTRIADTARSPLTATALALEVKAAGSVEQAVMLSCDLVHDAFKTALLKALDGRCPDLDHSKLTVNCTHTHTAPAMERGMYDEPEDDPDFMRPDEYLEWLAQQLADIVESAWGSRQPGSISRGFGYAVVGRCRRATYADGSSLMYGNTNRDDFMGFESCDDHAVNMLFTRESTGELTGMVVNLACPSQCHENLEVFHSDYWHPVRERVADRYGADVHVLPQCAPAGDLSPHLLADHKEEADLRARMGVDDIGIVTHRLMAAIEEGFEYASPPEDEVDLTHEVSTLRLPRLMVTEAQYELEKRVHKMSDEERAQQAYGFQRIWPFGLVADLIKRYEQQADNPLYAIESHVIRLGDVVFATNPFELYVDYGTRIRCRSRALQTFLIQLADGSGLGCYLPTQRAIDAGHYSALIKSNWVGPEAGQMLVDKTVATINRLFGEEEYARTR